MIGTVSNPTPIYWDENLGLCWSLGRGKRRLATKHQFLLLRGVDDVFTKLQEGEVLLLNEGLFTWSNDLNDLSRVRAR